MGEVEEVRGLIFYLLPCSECLYFEALARFLGGGRSQPSRLLPVPSFRVASSPRHDAGVCTRVRTRVNSRSCKQQGEAVWTMRGGGPPSITWGGRPLSFALFFLALHVSLASVLHSSESAKRHRSTGSRGSGSGRADARKYIG